MTPQERNLVVELFDRLGTLEDAPRDPEAEGLIRDGLRQAPNALYALVQSVLVQDEALKRANARITELEQELGMGQEPQRPAGFLDNMRDALFGGRHDAPPPRAGSVPSVRPGDSSGFAGPGMAAAPMQAPMPMGGGGSFLGTAAASAAGVIGGALLMDSIRSMMGGHHQGASVAGGGSGHEASRAASSPWGDNSGSGSGSGDLARDAGINNIGRGGSDTGHSGGSRSAGLFGGGNDDPQNDDAQNDDDAQYDVAEDDTDFGDDGGFDSGGDTA